MNILISLLKMLGGLSLLIYGMKLLSTQLKKISGGKLEKILMNVTDNPFKGLFVGFLITVATQSSATTTVIVVSLVNSGILKLKNSIPIIMGANIGTTINSQILRLANLEGNSFIALLSPANLAPIILLIGLIIMQRAKKQKIKDIGEMILGLGILFTGMITMVNMASTFSDLPILSTILQKLTNPILGVLSGALITAIVQSSAATIGILQALSTTGIITYSATIPIILGQNIGTCITSILASIGGNKNAKRVASVHLYFNLIGTIIFITFIYLYQSIIGFSFWNNAVDMGGIANFHTIFNIVSTIILFPFIKQLEKLTMLTVREDKTADDEDHIDDDYLLILNKLDDTATTLPSIAITNSISVIAKMGEITERNFNKSMELLNDFDIKKLDRVHEREDILDKMEERVTQYLINLESLNLSNDENTSISVLIRIASEFEKLGDYTYRLAKTLENIFEKDIKLSSNAKSDLKTIYNITEEIIITTIKAFNTKDLNLSVEIAALKEFSEILREKYKTGHMQRLKKGTCNVESGISFLEILTIYEKIVDHCLNISIAIYNFITHTNFTTKQDFYSKIYQKNTELIKNKINEYNILYN